MSLVFIQRLVLIFTMIRIGNCMFLENIIVLYTQPEQVHIAFGEDVSDIVVTWSTKNMTEAFVEYRKLSEKVGKFMKGFSRKFIDGGIENRTQYIHRVLLMNLTSNTTYVYRCGSVSGWSQNFQFTTIPAGDNWAAYVAIYGDLGNRNAVSLPFLQRESDQYHAVLHVGDFAYDFDSQQGETGNEFMRQIEPIAAFAPYMTSPGNHESLYNFSHYRARFSMPGRTEGLYYSYNLGRVHFISFSTEFYYYLAYGDPQQQFEWLKRDLTEANRWENRQKRPWIITLGHRPMYCTGANIDDCTHNETRVRRGLPKTYAYGLEDLFLAQRVDVEIWAHEHNYERSWPIYDYRVYNGSADAPYTNPEKPVHVTTGSAGSVERRDLFGKTQPWSAFRSNDYGFLRLKAYNKSHLHLVQVSTEKGGQEIDSIWIIKTKW